LSPFAALAGAAAASQLTGLLPGAGKLAGATAGLIGPAMCTYTAVLLADTATPSWHEMYRELPFLFAGSAMTAGAGALMLSVPPEQAGPARRMALLGAGLELAAERRISHSHGLLSEPWRSKRAGRLLTAARALTAVGAGLSLVGKRSRLAAAASGVSLLAAGLCTRFGAFDAGVESTKDPKYVVIPQRERLRGS
ncbi:MAG: NrfD/PsrC family molybdoenzyme membrane anchor subunit, partial [Sciscionella sp.]